MTSLPPFWVISLEAAQNRRDFVAQGFADVGVGFERIDAVDGARLTADDEHRYSRWRSLFQVGRGLTAGELGCALSHLEAYRRMVEAQIPEVVILEDDVQPTRDLLSLLGAADCFPPDADVVNFDPLFRSGGPTPVGMPLLDGKYRVCTYRQNPYGAACYRIPPTTAPGTSFPRLRAKCRSGICSTFRAATARPTRGSCGTSRSSQARKLGLGNS